MTEHDKPHRTIAALEDQQRSFGLDLTQQIAELRRRLEEVETSPQSGSGGAATPGGTAVPEKHGRAALSPELTLPIWRNVCKPADFSNT